MKSFCPACRQFIELVDEVCPTCGPGHGTRDEGCFFVSGDGRDPAYNGSIIAPGSLLLARFSIRRLLATGRFSAVYLAHDSCRDEDVALKAVDISEDDGQIPARQLLHEARVLAKFRDRTHVIEAYDIHTAPHDGRDMLLLAMPYADGGTLRQWLREHRNDPDTRRQYAIEYARQICLGMESIHREDVVLGDFKPENFLFVRGTICAADFGAAIPDNGFARAESYAHYFDPRKFSTPDYMSPEMFAATHPDEIDVRANVYSIGVLLFEMLHEKSRRPFYGDYDRLAAFHRSEPVPPLTGVSEELAAIVTKCLAKAPRERFQTVGELRAALEHASCDDSSPIEESEPMEVFAADASITLEKDEPARALVPAPRAPAPTGASEGAGDAVRLLDQTWRQACAARDSEDFDRANRRCNEVLSEVPDHPGALEMKREIAERFNRAQAIYDEGAREDGDLSLLQRVERLREAVALYLNHPAGGRVQSLLDDTLRRQEEWVGRGFAAVAEMDWDAALEAFTQAYAISGTGAGVLHMRRVVECIVHHRDRERERIDAALHAGKHAEARRLAEEIDRKLQKAANLIMLHFRKTQVTK